MADHPIYITREDYAKLRLLLSVSPTSGRSALLDNLRGELDRALVVDPAGIPAGVIAMGSKVEIEDVATGEIEAYTLVFPEQANAEEGRLSVLAPIGTALIGDREGEEVHWNTPGGVRQIRIRRVTAPAVAVGTTPESAASSTAR
jgi:regulator of nucleoside diphosphate kinase